MSSSWNIENVDWYHNTTKEEWEDYPIEDESKGGVMMVCLFIVLSLFICTLSFYLSYLQERGKKQRLERRLEKRRFYQKNQKRLTVDLEEGEGLQNNPTKTTPAQPPPSVNNSAHLEAGKLFRSSDDDAMGATDSSSESEKNSDAPPSPSSLSQKSQNESYPTDLEMGLPDALDPPSTDSNNNHNNNNNPMEDNQELAAGTLTAGPTTKKFVSFAPSTRLEPMAYVHEQTEENVDLLNTQSSTDEEEQTVSSGSSVRSGGSGAGGVALTDDWAQILTSPPVAVDAPQNLPQRSDQSDPPGDLPAVEE